MHHSLMSVPVWWHSLCWFQPFGLISVHLLACLKVLCPCSQWHRVSSFWVVTWRLLRFLPSSSGQLTGPNPRWGRRQLLSCHPTAAPPEPAAGGHAAESVRRACGLNAGNVTSVRTWRSLVDQGAWSSPASWDSASRWVSSKRALEPKVSMKTCNTVSFVFRKHSLLNKLYFCLFFLFSPHAARVAPHSSVCSVQRSREGGHTGGWGGQV